MRGGEIAQRVSASVSGGRAAVASPVWPSSLAGCMVAAAARWSIHLGASQQERERERLMAAIRARIKMVGPRQLYTDSGVMVVYASTHCGSARFLCTTLKWPTTGPS